MWSWKRSRVGSARRKGASERWVTCNACKAEEFVVQREAGRFRLREDGSAEFVPTRKDISCAPCFATYTVRVDGMEPFELGAPGVAAGAQGLVRKEPLPSPAVEAPSERETAAPGGIPEMDISELAELLAREPMARMQG